MDLLEWLKTEKPDQKITKLRCKLYIEGNVFTPGLHVFLTNQFLMKIKSVYMEGVFTQETGVRTPCENKSLTTKTKKILELTAGAVLCCISMQIHTR